MDNGVDLAALLDAVARLDCNASDAVLIDRISALERLKSAAAAAQARLTATFTDSRTAEAKARHQQMDAAQRSITGQIGLARRDSPHAGRRHVGVAAALVTDLPHTLAALTCGDVSERRARIIVEQLACLTPADRREADRLLAPELPHLGDRSAETRAAAIACRLDPEAVMAKVRGAVKDRHVGLRPAPDTMSRLSALLPVHLGVAVYAALCAAADSATATPGGDPRSRGQLMADALVSAVTGKHVIGCDPYGVPQYGPAAADTTAPDAAAAATAPPDAALPDTPATDAPETDASASDVPAPDAPVSEATDAAEPNQTAPAPTPAPTPASAAVAIRGCTGGCGISINLTMTDRTLLDCDDEPAHLTGFGPIPAALARALVISAADTTTRTWIRRLYTDPLTGQPTAMDSKRRLFPPAAQRFLLARDQTCRTPWCDAPIREYDHLQPFADGGATTTINGRGTCKACNLTKTAPGWTTRYAQPAATILGTTDTTATPETEGTGDVVIHLTAPTGHTYQSPTPPPPRSAPWADISHTEHLLAKALLWSA